MTVPEKIEKLRQAMKKEGIDALIAANSDPHTNEYVAAHWMFRAWLTGFHGSNGTVVITLDRAGLWTDSRYFIVAEEALQGTGMDLFRMGEDDVPELEKWICDQLDTGQTIAFSGCDTSLDCARKWVKKFKQSELTIRTDLNLVASLWTDRPPLPAGKVDCVPVEYTGRSCLEKLAQVREKMEADHIDAYLLGRTDEAGWLFNMRGTDLENSTVVLAYTLVTQDEVFLFVDSGKIDPATRNELQAGGCTLKPYGEIESVLKALPEKTRLLIDPHYINYALAQTLDHCQLVEERPIITDLKAIKNEVELENLRRCHIDDGAAMVNFIYWLYGQLDQGFTVSELSASHRLREFRAEIPGFRDVSFPSIMGYKAHGACNHYAVNEETDIELHQESLLLVDSGGTYLNGTTDITRVFPLGEITEEQKVDYTSVLKAVMRLSMATFPKNATCAHLDGICRSALWEHHRDFKHGTGHGIGFGLEVHEGPQGFGGKSQELMKPGMTTTIEPGLYRTGEYGIRIENIVVCIEFNETPSGPFHRFETLTCCPINTALVQTDMLSEAERTWLNDYHAWTYSCLADKLDEPERAWLEAACRPVS